MRNKILLISLVSGLFVGLLVNISGEPVETGFGKIKLNGLAQFWYQNDNGAIPKDTFRLRRAEIKFLGEIKSEIVSWTIMIDPAQLREDLGRKSPLQDFFITYKPCPCFSVDFGQFKTPFGMESMESSAKLDFIEKAMLASIIKWADYRDIGFALKGDLSIGNIKIKPMLGVYNGKGQNALDDNEPMDIAGRIVVSPISELNLGVAHYNGKSGSNEEENIRTGIEAKFTIEPLSVYGEYATGKTGAKKRNTYYIASVCSILQSLQVAVRYDYYDEDANVSSNAVTETTVGLNYLLEKHNAKLQLNYVFKGEEGPSKDNDIFRVNVQISY